MAGSVPNPKFARMFSGHFCELRVQRDTRNITLLVSLWFGSSLRYKLGMRANFRTATLGCLPLALQLLDRTRQRVQVKWLLQDPESLIHRLLRSGAETGGQQKLNVPMVVADDAGQFQPADAARHEN